MAALTVQTASPAGTVLAPTQITAWPAGDTIALDLLGERGVLAVVTNTSGGSLDFRVSDPGTTPAGNVLTTVYTNVPVANGATVGVVITKANVDPATGAVKVGASVTNAAFTIRPVRY